MLTDGRTDGRKIGRLYRTLLQAGAIKIKGNIVLGFNSTTTLVGHFVSSPREREKRDRRISKGDDREGQGRKRNRNESEETEEIKTSPSTITSCKDRGIVQL